MMEKKLYERAAMAVVTFDARDIITTSPTATVLPMHEFDTDKQIF